MADNQMVVSQWSAEFVTGLLPAAQKTALLYHLSYLCLGNFPNLERVVRSRAVETQLLFGSSDATLLKCILTSQNLVQSLFPMLTTAVEKNKADLAVKFLGKAREWITDIITDVDRIVERYELHNKDLALSTSDVVKEKEDADQKITPDDNEIKQAEKTLNDLKSELQKIKIFWENVAQMLDFLKQKTFFAEDHIDDLTELKDEFLESIKAAEEAWRIFGAGCTQASVIFKLQTKDAYKFLEISPSSLSSEEWKKQYESVKKQLEKIDPPPSVTSSVTPAISQ